MDKNDGLHPDSETNVNKATDAGTIRPGYLRCEYLTDPLCMDAERPRLSWIVESDERSQKQTRYRILVAGSRELLDGDQGDLWDSGVVESDDTAQIAYGGRPLASRTRCFWKVKVWDAGGDPSPWSQPATWSMGLLDERDWEARWIGYDPPLTPEQKHYTEILKPQGKEPETRVYLPCPLLRREFSVDKPVRRALVFATALGIYELHINGERVGRDYFMPGWTDYNKRIYYQAYDVTGLLRQDADNAMGAILSDGWYAGNIGLSGQRVYGDKLRLRAQLHIEYEDGSEQVVASDDAWRGMADGPIREADLQAGETYDARREITGWNEPGFDHSGWNKVMVTDSVDAAIETYPGIPVRKTIEIEPEEITEPKPRVFIFNLGQNFAGMARLKVSGEAGTRIVMRFGEMLNPDGTLYTENLRSARVTDTYILKGGGEEVWEPRFTFHGFQYVELTGFPGKPDLDAVTGIALYSDLPMVGSFECSHAMVNKLHSNIVWGQRSNYLEVPTDCPQRDERLGWLGDAQAFIAAAAYNMDIGAFFTKWMVDVEDGQHDDGGFPDTAPRATKGVASGWADAGVICPWTMYRVYGDKRIIERHYQAMQKWIELLKRRSVDYLAPAVGGYGDWLSVDATTPLDLITNAYFAYDARLMAEMAAAIGRDDDAEEYGELFRNVAQAFTTKYVSNDGVIQGDTQTGYLLALSFGLLPEELRPLAAERLVEKIKERDWSLSTGFLGAQLLLPTLTGIGRNDVACGLLTNRKYPSWGYSIDQGATTIWERWNSYTREKGFNDPGMNSFNHYAFGAVGKWMVADLAGIDTDGPGFRRIIIRPRPGGEIRWVKACYDSIMGSISTHWRYQGGNLKLDIVIPANTTATVYIPARALGDITESGRPTTESRGVTFLRMEPDAAVFEIGAGAYHFIGHNAI